MGIFKYALLIFGLLGHYGYAENTYVIFMPKYLRPGFTIQIVAEILSNPNPVKLSANLTSSDSAFSTLIEDTMEQGPSKTITFDETIPDGYTGSKKFVMAVIGTDTVTDEILINVTSKQLEFNAKSFSIFIQTDKAIYQPSQTIKFRAVVTTPELLPFIGNANFKLEDPESNIILQESNTELVKGLAGSEFTLDRYAPLGDWKLTYQVYNTKESLLISVEEYKLPKFEVKIEPDQGFLHRHSERISGKISAQFTFGQPVKGEARLELQISDDYYYYYRYDVRPQRNQRKIVKKFQNFKGESTFDFSAQKLIDGLGWEPESYRSTLELAAFVKDKNSMVELNATMTIDHARDQFKAEVLAKPESVKPGLPYKAYVRVTEYDGTLLSQSAKDGLGATINIQYSYPYIVGTWETPTRTVTEDFIIQDNGIAVVDVDVPADNFTGISLNVLTEFNPHGLISWYVQRFESPSNTFLQVSTSASTLSIGDLAELTIHTTEVKENYSILLLARGQVVKQEIYTPNAYVDTGTSSKFVYSFDITVEMSPSIVVIVSFVLPSGEIVADSIKLNVQASFANKVTIQTSTNKTDTGMPVEITVHADAGSRIGLRGIDQSVLLLKDGNDITQDKVFQDLDSYGTTTGDYLGWGRFSFWCGTSISGSNVPSIFDNAGILVFTDAVVFSDQPSYGTIYYGNEIMYNMVPEEAMAEVDIQMDSAGESVNKNIVNKPKVRKEFPETWLWEDFYAGADGLATFTYNTPDTITTWELSGFGISDTTGLGVTKQNSKVTVFRNFFISLDLPPTMIRGETLNLRTTVYNFFETDLTVRVTLEDSEWYYLQNVGNTTSKSEIFLDVAKQDGNTTVYSIKFTKVGVARISVQAMSELAGDAVERMIVVKPPGVEKVSSMSSVINRQEESDPESKISFLARIPEIAVHDSVRVTLAVSGNVLSNALNNLGSLLKMPYGCGEQNMINFAPDVFISLYLKKVGLLTGAVAEKSKSHIRSGYTRELRYQHKNGAFSAFGEGGSNPGSTWLTAFVTKCYGAAAQLNSDLVQPEPLAKAADFLVSQQAEEGNFMEPGTVSHAAMQGGVESKETMTSYVLIALLEWGYFSDQEHVTNAVIRAREFLESRITRVNDAYTLAVMAYALSLADSAEAETVMNLLEARAKYDGELKYWKNDDEDAGPKCEVNEFCYEKYNRATSSDIESTSYAFLALIRLGRPTSAVTSIVKWLVEQRGEFGGFHSTQDTVMGIQALAKYAGIFTGAARDLSLSATHSADQDSTIDFTVTEDNSLVLQIAELPNLPGFVNVTATGVGFADVQLNVIYNLLDGQSGDQPFVVTSRVVESDYGSVIELSVCSRIKEDPEKVVDDTGMFVILADSPSGFGFESGSSDSKGFQLAEVAGNEVTAYFDQLVRGEQVCSNLKFRRFAEISGLQPRRVEAYDYYKPDRRTVSFYESQKHKDSDPCSVCWSSICPPGCPLQVKGGAPHDLPLHILTFLTMIVVAYFA